MIESCLRLENICVAGSDTNIRCRHNSINVETSLLITTYFMTSDGNEEFLLWFT